MASTANQCPKPFEQNRAFALNSMPPQCVPDVAARPVHDHKHRHLQRSLQQALGQGRFDKLWETLGSPREVVRQHVRHGCIGALDAVLERIPFIPPQESLGQQFPVHLQCRHDIICRL